jgi:hypothetical protein
LGPIWAFAGVRFTGKFGAGNFRLRDGAELSPYLGDQLPGT